MPRTWSKLQQKHGADLLAVDLTAASNIALSDVWAVREKQIWYWDQAEYHFDTYKRGPFARIAMSPGGRMVSAVGSDGTLWTNRNHGIWVPVAMDGKLSAPIEDVSYDFAGNCWVTGTDGTVWTTHDDGEHFAEYSALTPVRRIATAFDGRQWGILATPDRPLWTRGSHLEPWFATKGSGFTDLSVSPDGDVWLITVNGSVMITRDGESFTTLTPDPFGPGPFHAVQAMNTGEAYLAADTDDIWYTEPGYGGSTYRMKFVNLAKYDGYLRNVGPYAQFVAGQSLEAVLERVPLGNHRIALRNHYGDWVDVEPNGHVTISSVGSPQIFIEIVHEDGRISLTLPYDDRPRLPLGSWRGVPGKPDLYPDIVLMDSEEIGDDQKFWYGVPDDALLPLGRNESIPDNSGSRSGSPSGVHDGVFSDAIDFGQNTELRQSKHKKRDIVQTREKTRWRDAFENPTD